MEAVMGKVYRIAVVPGDGTGPEVVEQGLKVLDAAAGVFGFETERKVFPFGGDHYLKTGETLSEGDIAELRSYDAILLGAIGHPDVKPGILEQGILLRARFALDQYVNLRPVRLYEGVESPLRDKGPEHIDFVVVRENSEGLYVGSGGFLRKGTPDEIAIQESVNTRKGVERCIRFAFEYCRKRNRRKKLTLVGKTNVLTFAFDLWERAFNEVGQEYPDVERDYAHVDACCMWMVKNPEWFDVIVTDNMFGDIITDLGAMVQGGMGVAAGGNINPQGVSMFEPIGGSAPKYTGKNVINPLAAIVATGMLVEHLGEGEAARCIEEAVQWATSKKLRSLAAGRLGYSTSEVGDLIVAHLRGEAG
jgi:3-isopropylmalate dehydrogenase